MGERRPLNVRVDEDVITNFREYTYESKGQIRGEMGRLVEAAMIEYMDNDRSARIEQKVDDLPEQIVDALSEELLERERRTSQSTDTDDSTPQLGNKTQESLTRISAEIPDNTAISEAMVETAVENNAGASYKTLQKYKRLLKKNGHIFEHPVEPDKFVTSSRTLAVICEQNEQIKPPDVHEIISRYEDFFDDKEWYLKHLPNRLVKRSDLKAAKVYDPADLEAFRRDHDLLDNDRDRGVQ